MLQHLGDGTEEEKGAWLDLVVVSKQADADGAWRPCKALCYQYKTVKLLINGASTVNVYNWGSCSVILVVQLLFFVRIVVEIPGSACVGIWKGSFAMSIASINSSAIILSQVATDS